MSLSAEQLHALDDFPPPASLDRIMRFLSDLGEQGNTPLGESGQSAQAFSKSLAGGAASFSARQVGGWASILMDRYQIKIGEIQEFALWFVQRQEILTETPDQVVQDPDPALARPAAPEMALANPPAPVVPAMDFAVSAAESAAPRKTLRRQPVAALPEITPAAPPDDLGMEVVPAAAPEDQPRRRQKTRAARPGTVPRGRRIERGPAPLEAKEAPDSEGIPEESVPPPRRPFRLAPRMIARPAFVTNVGLAGMLAGMSLGGMPAAAMDAPAMTLAIPPAAGLGPVPGTLPIYGPMGSFPPASSPPFGPMAMPAPTVTPSFSPLVTPMTPGGPPPVSPVWLGMPPAPAPALPTPSPTFTPSPPPTLPLAAPDLARNAPPTLDALPGVPVDTLVGAPPSAGGSPVPSTPFPSGGSPFTLPGSAPMPPDGPAGANPALSQSPGSRPLLFSKPLPLAIPPSSPAAPDSSPSFGAAWGSQGGIGAPPPALNGLAAGSAAVSFAGRFLPPAQAVSGQTASDQAASETPAAPGQPGGVPPAGAHSLVMPPAAPPAPGATWDAQSGGWTSPSSFAGRFLPPAGNASDSRPTPGSFARLGGVGDNYSGGNGPTSALSGLAAGSAAVSFAGRFLPPAQAPSGQSASDQAVSETPAAPGQPGGVPPAGAHSLVMPPAAPPAPGATWDAQSGGWTSPSSFGNRLAAGSAAFSLASRFLPPADGSSAFPAAPGAGPTVFGMPPRPHTAFTGTAVGSPHSVPGRDGTSDLTPDASFAVTPEMGQMTLLAPPLQIASDQAERAGVAASVDWKTLAGGIGPLDEGGMMRLKGALPAEASVLYPALPPGSLGKGAVNLPLSAPLVQSLLRKGYGKVGANVASQAADMGARASGGKPPAAPLQASLVPTSKRPAGSAPGLLGHADEAKGGAGALAEAGRGQSARGGALDFLGLPVRLAPSLGGGSGLARETAARNTGLGPVRPQQTLRPERFAPLRNRVFPAFHSMVVEPDKAAWHKAAPALGLRDVNPTTLLSPDARVPVQTLTAPQPPSRPRSSASAPTPSAFTGPQGPLSPARLLTGHRAPGSHGVTGSRYLPGGHLPESAPHGMTGVHRAGPGPLSLASPVHPSLGHGSAFPAGAVTAPLSAHHPLAQSRHAVSPALGHLTPTSHVFAPLAGSGKAGTSVFPTPHRAVGTSPRPLGLRHLPSASAHGTGGSGRLPSFGSAHAAPSRTPGRLSSSHLSPALAHVPSASVHGTGGSGRLPSFGSAHAAPFRTPSKSSIGHTAPGSGGSGWMPSRTPMSSPAKARTTSASAPSLGVSSVGSHSVGSHSVGSHSVTPPRFTTVLPSAGASPGRPAALGSHFATPSTPGALRAGGLAPSRPTASASGSAPSLPAGPHPAFRTAMAVPPHGAGVASPSHAGRALPALAMSPGVIMPHSHRASHLLTPQMPPLSLSSGRGRSGGVLGSRMVAAPAMRFAPVRGVRQAAAGEAVPPMTIQRAITSASDAPARHEGQSPAPPPPAMDGAAKSDVNALAGEVYSLIKRRLAVEADRRGRW